jgi:biotin carboxylase
MSLLGLNELKKFLKKKKLNNKNYIFISSQSDHSLLLAKKLNAINFNLKDKSFSIEKLSVFKNLQRKLMINNHKILNPNFLYLEKIKNFSYLPKDIRVPAIIKPNASSGSQGVIKVLSNNKILSLLKISSQYSLDKKILLENYIKGTHYIVDIFCDQYIYGIKSKSANGILTKHIKFQRLKKNSKNVIEKKLFNVANEVIRVFNFDINLHVTIEFIFKKNGGIYLLEAANRGAGVCISNLIFSHLTGCDIASLFILKWINLYKKFDKDFTLRSIPKYNNVVLKYSKKPPSLNEKKNLIFNAKLKPKKSSIYFTDGVFLNNYVFAVSKLSE